MTEFQEYLLMLRLHIRMQLSLSSFGGRGQKRPLKETAKLLGFAALILYAVGAVLVFYSLILFPFLKGAAEAGLAIPVMGAIILLSMLMVLVFGTLTLLSLVFGAKDAAAFAALPLREQSVFAAKFTMVYGIELAVTALFLLPAVVIYGIVAGFSLPAFFFLILRALPVWLLLPMVPMALASLLSMVFTRLTAFSKRRDLMMSLFGIVLVFGLVIGQAALLGHFAPAISDEEAIAALLSDNSAMLDAVTGYFPPAMWASRALLGQNAAGAGIGFFGLLASAALGCYVCLLLSRRLYYKGVLAQMEAPKSKKIYKVTVSKTGSPLRAFLLKEIKIILRTPVYAMNILVGVAIFPIMFAAVSFGGGGGLSAGGDAMAGLFAFLESSEDMKLLLAAAVVMITGVTSSTGVATTFSREGRNLWISQTAPVSAGTQLWARILAGGILTAAGSVLSLSVLSVFLGFTIEDIGLGAFWGWCAAVLILTASVIPDALKPKRKWNSESEAIKQNLNSVFALLIGLGLAVGIGFAAFGLSKLMPIWAAGSVVAAGCVFAGMTLLNYAERITEEMLKTVDG
jgi:ABC-2 type transport system permease protein